MMRLRFTKMQATGNDFVVIDDREGAHVGHESELARAMCRRRTAIGADGIIFIRKPELGGCKLKMVYHNADGSYSGMCGNGIRCVAWYGFLRLLRDKDEFSIQVGESAHQVRVEPSGDARTGWVTVNMGVPALEVRRIPAAIEGVSPHERWVEEKLDFAPGLASVCTLLSMGNPHCVIWVDELADELVHDLGPRIETSPAFPERVNASFARLIGEDRLQLRVWERGVGETMSCGSGACAAVAAGILAGKLRAGEEIRVELPGGELFVNWEGEGKPVWMRGPATLVYEGEFNLGG